MGQSSTKFCGQDDYILKIYRGESEIEQLYFQNDADISLLCSEGAAFGSLSMLCQSWQKSLRHSSTFDHSREPGGDISTSGRENT